ncbi:MAG: hypothetical protein KGH72_03415 [Candidatus Micrarchaeota archaeon]|nr:hypothetical protein [Candidatus Micrarchaeota archaeon]
MLSATERNRRIQKCEGTMQSNCIGTAMYLVGMQPEDRYVGDDRRRVFEDILKSLQRIDEPRKGCLVSWQREDHDGTVDVIHVAVVTSAQPLLVMHRAGAYEPFYKGIDISVPDGVYWDYGRVCYIPDTSIAIPEELHYPEIQKQYNDLLREAVEAFSQIAARQMIELLRESGDLPPKLIELLRESGDLPPK